MRKQGFLNGIKSSRFFVPLVSTGALEWVRNYTSDHAHDNVLLEYETALKIMTALKKPNYIFPVLVAEYISMGSAKALVKFCDFAPCAIS